METKTGKNHGIQSHVMDEDGATKCYIKCQSVITQICDLYHLLVPIPSERDTRNDKKK